MLFKTLAVALLPAAAVAQQNLTAALGSNPNLSNLTTYLGAYPSIVSQLSGMSNITLLAPNNNAFSKLLNSSAGASFQANDTALITAFFSYHVLMGTIYASSIMSTPAFVPTALTPATSDTSLQPGAVVEAVLQDKNALFISGLLTQSTVTQANTNFTGGVIHVIDTFLTLPQNISTTLVALNETAVAGALGAANVAPLPPTANMTAFLPNNNAFQAIGNILANLSSPALAATLGYHIVPNSVLYSTDLANTTLTTSTNATLQVTNLNGTIFVNNAKVVIPNVIYQQGVIHVIDEVLNAANTTAVTNPSTTVPAFAGASSVNSVPFTSGIPTPSSVPSMPGASSSAASGGSGSGGSGGAKSTSKSAMAMPMQTGAVAVAALMGGAAAVLNI